MLHGGMSTLSLQHGRRKRARVSFADDITDPFSTDLCPLSLDPEVLPILPAAVLSLRDKDEQGISTSFGLVKIHGKYEMDILSFGCGLAQAQQPDHHSFSVRIEPRQEAEGSCISHAVVVQFVAEQAGPQTTSFSISIPDSGNSSSIQMQVEVRVSATVMGRHKGTPALRSSVHMVGRTECRSDTEDSTE